MTLKPGARGLERPGDEKQGGDNESNSYSNTMDQVTLIQSAPCKVGLQKWGDVTLLG
jgi:hypothetical protein